MATTRTGADQIRRISMTGTRRAGRLAATRRPAESSLPAEAGARPVCRVSAGTRPRRLAMGAVVATLGRRLTPVGMVVALLPIVRPALHALAVELPYWLDRVLDVALVGAILLLAAAAGSLTLR